MSSPFFRVIHGHVVIAGKEPDGDSMRFVARNPELYRTLWRAYRVRLSRDRSVQLRFEGVDAPECHYGAHAQPLGAEARDTVLTWLGFADVRFAADTPTVVTASRPAAVPAAILTHGADVNGRPICYMLPADVAQPLADGDWVRVHDELLGQTLNARLLSEGLAYAMVYTSTPFDHRQALRAIAVAARDAGRGVWGLDSTAEFRLDGQAALGPDGQLILPKLFRRCTDYLTSVAQGFRGDLQDWLIAISRRRSRDENDRVIVREAVEVRLSDLIEQRNRWISFSADPLDLTFVEK